MWIRIRGPIPEVRRHEMEMREFLAMGPFGKSGLTEEQAELYRIALTHDSFASEAHDSFGSCDIESNERLEFLGDAVLEFIACEDIYLNSGLKEGMMTDFKQGIVANRKISQKVKERFDFDDIMLVGRDYIDGNTKRNMINDNMRADAFEAFVAATYLNYGMEETKRLVKAVLW